MSAKAGVNLGLLSVEVSEKKPLFDDEHHKIEFIIQDLKAKKLLGTSDSNSAWIVGEMELGSIKDGHQVFFAGQLKLEDGRTTYIVFLASADHMIGSGPDLESAHSVPTQIYETNSNNWMFGHTMTKLFRAEDLAAGIEYSFNDNEGLLFQKYKLTQEEKKALEDRSEFNEAALETNISIFSRLSFFGNQLPNFSWKSYLLNPFRIIYLKIKLGKDLYARKRDAALKNFRLDNLEKTRLNADEATILSAGHSVAQRISFGGGVRVEYVARRLLQGYSSKDKIIVASPLYLALTPRF
jgi:hypothetical protein